jgi:hypothetical protein
MSAYSIVDPIMLVIGIWIAWHSVLRLGMLHWGIHKPVWFVIHGLYTVGGAIAGLDCMVAAPVLLVATALWLHDTRHRWNESPPTVSEKGKRL